MNDQRTIFTASETALALGCTRQNIHKQLRRIPEDGQKLVSGNLAKAWAITSFPEPLVRQLTVIAQTKRYHTIADLLSMPFKRFKTPFPIQELSPTVLTRATRLRRALRGILPLRNDRTITAAAFAVRGLEAYKREFGHVVSAKHWRTLVDRTIERDNGAEEWGRLDLYIGENPSRVPRTLPIALSRAKNLDVLEDVLTDFQGAARLTASQLVFLWTRSCDQLQLEIEAGAPPKKIKRAIIQVLLKSGFVGSDLKSVRRNFDRKWKAYAAADGLLQDKRSVRYANSKPVVNEEDRSKLVAAALDCGGRVSQAYREQVHGGQLSQEITDRYIANPLNKSHVPHAIRKAVTPETRRLMPLHHGPRENELRGAYRIRDYSMLFAGDSYQADDCTCPVVYWEHDATSQTGYRIMRGQLLLMIDERSLLALGFALHSEKNYNARIIRALITRVHDAFGLPRRRFYFERGIWKSSKILTGERSPVGELGFNHTEMGLQKFGVKFCHAKLPRGKVIERVLGLVQNKMEGLPGYVGRNEISDRFERVQKQMREATSGALHPATCFLSKSQWETELTKLLIVYNSERQQGRQLRNLSPLEAWNKFQASEPQVHLGDEARYLLAHHQLKLRVRANGITLRPSLGGGTYLGEATGPLVGEDALVWFNPEDPEYIALTSLDLKRGPFVVPRQEPLPAIDATNEQMARSEAQIEAHNDYAKTAYRLIAPHLAKHSFRRLAPIDTRTITLGEDLQTGVERVKTQQGHARASLRRVHSRSRELNMRPAGELTIRNADQVAEGYDLMAESKQLRAAQKVAR
jgi:hypothetical protein